MILNVLLNRGNIIYTSMVRHLIHTYAYICTYA